MKKRLVLIIVFGLCCLLPDNVAAINNNSLQSELAVPMKTSRSSEQMFRHNRGKYSPKKQHFTATSSNSNSGTMSVYRISDKQLKSYGGGTAEGCYSNTRTTSLNYSSQYSAATPVNNIPLYPNKGGIATKISMRRDIDYNSYEERDGIRYYYDDETEDYTWPYAEGESPNIGDSNPNGDGTIWNGHEWVDPASEVGEDVPVGEWPLCLMLIMIAVYLKRNVRRTR